MTILGCILIGFSIYSLVYFKATTSEIKTLSSRNIKIETLMIDFNRIMALLKDQASGFSSNFPSMSLIGEINDSFQRLNSLK